MSWIADHQLAPLFTFLISEIFMIPRKNPFLSIIPQAMMFIYISLSDVSRFTHLLPEKWMERENLMKIKCQKFPPWKLFHVKNFQCHSSSLRNENKNIFPSLVFRVWAEWGKLWKYANGKSIFLPVCAFSFLFCEKSF